MTVRGCAMRTKILIAVGATLVVTLAGAAVWAQVGLPNLVRP